jgi:hypothetical protein
LYNFKNNATLEIVSKFQIPQKLKSLLCLLVLVSALVASAAPVHADASLTGWQKGILVQPDTSTDYSSTNFQQSMRNAAADGVNYVSLVIPLSQSNIYSSDVSTDSTTPTNQSLVSGIEFIHSLGMHVALILHDDPNDGQWRAMINPTNRPTWFANYGQILDQYADIAQANNVEEIIIATEMSSLTIPSYSSQNTPGWINMIQNVRTQYSGLLTYGAEHGGYMADDTELGFWNYLDEIGISAYYSMGNSSSTVADMESDWSQVDASELKGLAAEYNKPMIFIEAGYVSGDNALGDPGSAYLDPGNVNLTIQANAYQALLAYWSNSTYMSGVSFWDWSADPNAGGSNDDNYTPQNKPAEQVMKQWFTGHGTSNANQAAAYTITSGSPNAVSTNTSTTSTVNVSSSQPLYGTIVDVEIYNSSGTQIAQQFYQNQNITSTATSYQVTWTPPQDGQYSLKAGIFTANWQSNIDWNNSVATLASTTPAPIITQPLPTPTQPVNTNTNPSPTPTNSASIDIWWPSNGSSVSGIQPFKALIDGIDQNSYKMYWQVDGGQLNSMTVNNSGGAHQEADVDLSGWNWHGNGGQYVVNFVAKDLNGNIIAQKSTTITIYN